MMSSVEKLWIQRHCKMTFSPYSYLYKWTETLGEDKVISLTIIAVI